MLKYFLNLFKSSKIDKELSISEKYYNEHINYRIGDEIILYYNENYTITGNSYEIFEIEYFLPDKIKFLKRKWIDINKFNEDGVIDFINYSYFIRDNEQKLYGDKLEVFNNDKLLNYMIHNLDYIEYGDVIKFKLKNSKIFMHGRLLDFIEDRYLLVGNLDFGLYRNYYKNYLRYIKFEYCFSCDLDNINLKNKKQFELKNIYVIDLNNIEELEILILEERKLNSLSNDYTTIIK